jgi:hypothetical protein
MVSLISPLHWAGLPGTLPTAWNAGIVEIAKVTEDFSKNKFQQREQTIMLNIEKVPLQGLFQCPRQACQAILSATTMFTRGNSGPVP